MSSSRTGGARHDRMACPSALSAPIPCPGRTARAVREEYIIGRFVADAEALSSYESTREIHTLIVSRAITGFSAFV